MAGKTENIVLFQEMIFKTGLSYKKACEVLSLASKKVTDIDFFLKSRKGYDRYCLCGHIKSQKQAFMKDPESFVIEV